jgi:sarcosine oxidase
MFDVIVIGVGSMGSSTCYHLASRGYNVLGLEQFDTPHENGSHAGQSRIIRKAYFEHPDYVPLLNAAYENWEQLEQETGVTVYHRTGVVYFGPAAHPLVEGVQRSARLYNIPLEVHEHPAIKQKFPQFTFPGDFICLLEPDAGFIQPEKSITLYKQQALVKGAKIHSNEKVIQWEKQGNEVLVTTVKGQYRCRKLIITAGAWSGNLVPSLCGELIITRQALAWIHPKNGNDFTKENFCCWMIADDQKSGCYYGFPLLASSEFGLPDGLKIAYHYPGNITDPDHVNRDPAQEDYNEIKYCLHKYFAATIDPDVTMKVCLYANSPDENFIIDKLPGFEDHVSIACGFSGHGFKFVSVVGEILADLSINGTTKHPIGFLSAKRF